MTGQLEEFKQLLNAFQRHKDAEAEQLRQQLQQQNEAQVHAVQYAAEQRLAEERQNVRQEATEYQSSLQQQAAQYKATVDSSAQQKSAQDANELLSIRRQLQQQFEKECIDRQKQFDEQLQRMQTDASARQQNMSDQLNFSAQRLAEEKKQNGALSGQVDYMNEMVIELQNQLAEVLKNQQASKADNNSSATGCNSYGPRGEEIPAGPGTGFGGGSVPAPRGGEIPAKAGEFSIHTPRDNNNTNATSSNKNIKDTLCKRGAVADKISLLPLPTAPQFEAWKLQTLEEIAGATIIPEETFAWLKEAESATCFENLADSGDFTVVDVRLGAAIARILTGELARKINVIKMELAKNKKMLKGRQYWWIVLDHFRIAEAEGAVLDFEDLLACCSKGDLPAFLNDWFGTLTGMKTVPGDEILEAMFRKQVQNHPWLTDQMSYYNRLDIGHIDKNYQWLISTAKKEIETRRRQQTRDELARGRKAQPTNALAATKGICFQFKKSGKCARGDDCPFQHVQGDDAAEKPLRNRPTSRNRGDRSPSKGNGKGQVGVCHFYLKGICKNGKDCSFKHPPPCKNYAKGSCRFGKDCNFAHVREKTSAAPAEDSEAEDVQERARSPSPKKNKNKAAKGAGKPEDVKASVAFEVNDEMLTGLLCTTKKVDFDERNSEGIHFEVEKIRPYGYEKYRKKNISKEKPPITRKLLKISMHRAIATAKSLCKDLGIEYEKVVVTKAAAAKTDNDWIVDSGAGRHLTDKRKTTAEQRQNASPCNHLVETANGLVKVDKEVSLDLGFEDNIQALVMDRSPNVLSLGRLCMENGYDFEWRKGLKPVLTRPDGTDIVLEVRHYVPILSADTAA